MPSPQPSSPRNQCHQESGTKIFKLSNATKHENKLTQSQKDLKDSLCSILMNDKVISIPASSPRFWETFWTEMSEKYSKRPFVTYKEAKQLFEDLVTKLRERAQVDELGDLSKEEFELIELLEKQLRDSSNTQSFERTGVFELPSPGGFLRAISHHSKTNELQTTAPIEH